MRARRGNKTHRRRIAETETALNVFRDFQSPASPSRSAPAICQTHLRDEVRTQPADSASQSSFGKSFVDGNSGYVPFGPDESSRSDSETGYRDAQFAQYSEHQLTSCVTCKNFLTDTSYYYEKIPLDKAQLTAQSGCSVCSMLISAFGIAISAKEESLALE